MRKNEFERLMYGRVGRVREVVCRVWKSFDGDRECLWLDVFFYDREYVGIFTSDCYYMGDSSKVYELQKSWGRKLKQWVPESWGIRLVIDEMGA